jgi:N-methylhydantoinase A/oxoprolinase/acetone carboxylase beta subunit
MKAGTESIPMYNYEELLPGMRFMGPALIVSADTTILLNNMDCISVDNYQNILIDIGLENLINN